MVNFLNRNPLVAYEAIRKYQDKCDNCKSSHCKYCGLCQNLSVVSFFDKNSWDPYETSVCLKPWKYISKNEQNKFKRVFLKWLVSR